MKSHLFYLHAISALHVGTGQAAGAVDLPIARSRATHLPIVPSSGIKGVLRATCEGDSNKAEYVKDLFGPDSISASDQAQSGALMVGDAHLLLLPVRSLKGVMAWVTCPFVLKRYQDDLIRAGKSKPETLPVVKQDQALCCEKSPNLIPTGPDHTLVLEDLDLSADTSNSTADSWRTHLANLFSADETQAKHIVIVPDDVFSFLAENATEIRTRVKIDNAKGVVEKGGLWTEENLPSETVLWGLLGLGKVRGQNTDGKDCEEQWTSCNPNSELLQMGGNTTVGRGLVRWISPNPTPTA